jgi:hypothetical protein
VVIISELAFSNFSVNKEISNILCAIFLFLMELKCSCGTVAQNSEHHLKA